MIVIFASCSRSPETVPSPEQDSLTTMPAPVVPKPVPLVVDEYNGDPSQWKTHTFTLEDHKIKLKLPDGVSVSPNIGECSIETTRDSAPKGFLINSVYDVIKVGRIYFPINIERIDDETYQVNMFSGMYGSEEEIVTFTYSEEIKDDVFFRHDNYIVFLSSGDGLFDAIEYYDEDSGIMISFWRTSNEEVFEKQGMPMFEDIVSTVEVSTVEAE